MPMATLPPPTTTIVSRHCKFPRVMGGWGGGGGNGAAQKLASSDNYWLIVLSAFWAPLFLQVHLPTITQNRGVHEQKTDEAVSPIVFSFPNLCSGLAWDVGWLWVFKRWLLAFVGDEPVMGGQECDTSKQSFLIGWPVGPSLSLA